ncbi:MAG: hypothetical protein GWN01_05650 [Nitrosopumilaceae archaeon]|nr:hypothetical protein [Nitrosopumilaceae archaeon]NIU00426.1 hypothetical protein [Nitrosopumilaceae archaeon]NIU87103.1 hypothetical protein [Nitrosopumilaceae archaeon]NIV65658.1 hypothetical protein [Nitrosopumilaceae archaeon]NIX61028.1 hypothetical protein [Nitrosopumilaceae archaeon]
MKGVYWLILGLSIWFVPSIIIRILSDKTGIEAETLPLEIIIVQFVIAAAIMIKAVFTIRKERRARNSKN